MKFVIIALALAALVYADDRYEEFSDDLDVTELLQNDRLLKSYLKCLLGKGPCTPEIKQVKDKIPEALATRCAKCTEKQKRMGRQLAQELKNHHPTMWADLVLKYDPKGEHQQAFKDFLA